MKDKLVVDVRNGQYRVFWLLAEEHELGACLGEGPDVGDDECAVACRAAGACSPAGKDYQGYFWESISAATKAKRAANAALKIAKSAKPWPEWAKQALAAGWKAPKGWEP